MSGAALVLALDDRHADAAASLMEAMRRGWFNGYEIRLVRDLHGLDLAARPEYAKYLEAHAREKARLRALYAD